MNRISEQNNLPNQKKKQDLNVQYSTDKLYGTVITFSDQHPLQLDCGQSLKKISIAYQTYGTLNPEKNNAILVCHALTGDQHVANTHPVTEKPGWWSTLIGPGKPIDTDHFFVICPNIIGGCMGSTGPSSLNPDTQQPYGLDFPVITIADMVRAQAMLIDALSIDQLFCIIGGSMGGMQVLQWVSDYPERVFCAAPIATTSRHSSQNIAFHEVGRQAVMADPEWHDGRYFDHETVPAKGLAVARMAAHITYLSEQALHNKFGRNLQDRDKLTFGFDADFQVESYLRYQGLKFVERFDPNSYLYITRAMDYFDLAADHNGVLAKAFSGVQTRFCIVSFTSDWLYPTEESRTIVHALNAVAAKVSFLEVESDKGHDAFLLDEPDLFNIISSFIHSAAKDRHLPYNSAILDKIHSNIVSKEEHTEDIETVFQRRVDLLQIADLVTDGSRVLDVGCGDGLLLRLLNRRRHINGRGIEIDATNVNTCLSKGLSVIKGDAESDLAYFPDDSFDYAILSQTIQTMQNPKKVLEELLRIGKHVIVSFPNFGHWSIRLKLLFSGEMPKTDILPYEWYETPNIHYCSIDDFQKLCHDVDARVEELTVLDWYGRKVRFNLPVFTLNSFGEQAVFLLSKK